MQYLLLLHSNESGWDAMTTAERAQGVAAYEAYGQALREAGAYVSSNRLQPSATATTIRVTEGKSQVHDGPFVDIKEQLGGYYLIEAADLDAALAWAEGCPGAHHGAIEVRPVWNMAS